MGFTPEPVSPVLNTAIILNSKYTSAIACVLFYDSIRQ